MTDDKLTSYGRVLRARRRVYLWCGAAGLAGVMVCLILLPDGGMPPIALAFYRGGSFGLLFAGLFQALRTQRLLKRPERWKELRIREIDERQRHIDRAAAHFAGAAVMYLQFAAALVLAAVDWRLGLLMSGLILAYFALFLLARWRLSKKV